MSIYDNNIAVFKKFNKYKGKFLRELLTSVKKDNNLIIESIDSKDGNKALIVGLGEKIYRLNSNFKPLEEAKKWAEQYEFTNINAVMVMYGFGNGIMLREVLRRMENDEKIIIYEPSIDLFLYIVNNYSIVDLIEDKRVDILVADLNGTELTSVFESNVNWRNLKSLLVCTHPKYDEIFQKDRKLFIEIIEDSKLKIIANMNTEINFGKILTKCMINNMKFISNSNTIKDLVGVFPKDMPAIIVSAGPSLDNNIEELRRAKGKALIIAVDTAVQHLMKKNILPDFTITIDPIKPPEYYNDERLSTIPLLLESASNYKIISKHKGRKFFFAHHEYYTHLYKELESEIPIVVTGGSVSTSALAVCTFLGFKRIILVGQDLAYKDGTTHAGGTVDVSTNNADDIFVEDIYGNQIKTRYDWYYYLKWFNEAIEVLNNKGIMVIDATEGGAKIKGTENTTLTKAIDFYGIDQIDINEIIEKVNNNFNDKDTYIIERYIRKNIEDLDIIKGNSKEAIGLCNNLINEYNKISDESYKSISYNKELSKINEIIAGLPINGILNGYISSINIEQLSDIYEMSENEKDNKIKTYISAKSFYEANINGVDDIKLMLNELLEVSN